MIENINNFVKLMLMFILLSLFDSTLRLTAGESLIPESSLFILLPRINTMAATFNKDLL